MEYPLFYMLNKKLTSAMSLLDELGKSIERLEKKSEVIEKSIERLEESITNLRTGDESDVDSGAIFQTVTSMRDCIGEYWRSR